MLTTTLQKKATPGPLKVDQTVSLKPAIADKVRGVATLNKDPEGFATAHLIAHSYNTHGKLLKTAKTLLRIAEGTANADDMNELTGGDLEAVIEWASNVPDA